MPTWWWIGPAIAVVLGVIVLFGGLKALFGGKLGKALGGIGVGGLVLALAVFALMAGLDVLTYRRLTYERPVASIELKKKGERLFDLTMTLPAEGAVAASSHTYEMNGDEWRVEARVLKWKPWAHVIGLDTQYRLERLAGEYIDTASELSAKRSVYDLKGDGGSSIDLWALARRYKSVPVVDTLYGSAALMPMADGAKYEVWITQSGLIARPANDAATQSIGGWS